MGRKCARRGNSSLSLRLLSLYSAIITKYICHVTFAKHKTCAINCTPTDFSKKSKRAGNSPWLVDSIHNNVFLAVNKAKSRHQEVVAEDEVEEVDEEKVKQTLLSII